MAAAEEPDAGSPPAVGAGIAVGNTLEAVVGVWLLRHVAGFDPGFARLRDVGSYLLFGVIACTTLSATIGVGALVLSGGVQTNAAPAVWFTWWLGNAGGAAVVRAVSVSLTSTSQSSALEAFDCFGQLVDVSVGGASSTLSVQAAQIRSVTVQQGPMAFDDFTFGGLRPAAPRLAAPTPGAAGATNTFTVGCAPEDHPFLFLVGLAPGPSSFGGCHGLTLGLQRPRPLGVGSSDQRARRRAETAGGDPGAALGLALARHSRRGQCR